MGSFISKKKETSLEGEEVNFDHFQVIRAIGRGSFGKVCIVQKRDTKQMFAMKYVNKEQCRAKDALSNVFREIEILSSLSHPFLVNLWYSFQDAEDMFTVVELLLGGDLRYHLQQGVQFGDEAVRLYILEIASALVYLHSKNIIHRDIKPDNLLLDEEGHVHLTDFNIAAVLKPGTLATSMSGTKPYMAPEIFACTADQCSGYGRTADWWSLGVTAFELRMGKRPFDIHSATTIQEIMLMFQLPVRVSSEVQAGLVKAISGLLVVDPGRRIQSLESLSEIPFMSSVSMEDVMKKKKKPTFTPPKDHLNCDPTFELEEMIIESRPLHKKKKRLSKQKSLTHTSHSGNTEAEEEKYGGMLVFNREVEERKRKEREKEKREKEWQQELEESMRQSDPTGHGCSFTGSQCSTPLRSTTGHQQHSADLCPPQLTLKTGDLSPSVKKRLAGSPKVKVRGSTVTIESPRSSSSSKNSNQYLQDRLKELQAEQRLANSKTEPTSDVTYVSHSQDSVHDLSSNEDAGIEATPHRDNFSTNEVADTGKNNNNNNNNDLDTKRVEGAAEKEEEEEKAEEEEAEEEEERR